MGSSLIMSIIRSSIPRMYQAVSQMVVCIFPHAARPGVDGFHGSLLRGSVSAAKVGEQVGHDFLQAVYPAQRAAQIRHMLGCFASGFMCHAPTDRWWSLV